jgi:hypothetical protein
MEFLLVLGMAKCGLKDELGSKAISYNAFANPLKNFLALFDLLNSSRGESWCFSGTKFLCTQLIEQNNTRGAFLLINPWGYTI